MRRMFAVVFTAAIALTSQVHSECPFLAKNKKADMAQDIAEEKVSQADDAFNYDPPGLKDHPDRDEIIKNFKAWYSCRFSNKPRSECDELYEILVSPAQSIIKKVHEYKDLNKTATDLHSECVVSGNAEDDCKQEKSVRDKALNQLKEELYPWLDVYEICNALESDEFCDSQIKFLHLPDYRHMKPEELVFFTNKTVCLRSGKSMEECVAGMKMMLQTLETANEEEDRRESKAAAAAAAAGGDEL